MKIILLISLTGHWKGPRAASHPLPLASPFCPGPVGGSHAGCRCTSRVLPTATWACAPLSDTPTHTVRQLRCHLFSEGQRSAISCPTSHSRCRADDKFPRESSSHTSVGPTGIICGPAGELQGPLSRSAGCRLGGRSQTHFNDGLRFSCGVWFLLEDQQ